MFYGLSEVVIFFFKQKTAYELRISDWSSDVCSSDLKEKARETAHRSGGELQAIDCRCRAINGVAVHQMAVGRDDRDVGDSHEAKDMFEVAARKIDFAAQRNATRGKEIGRESCRERVCQSGTIWSVDVSLKKKRNTKQ